MLNRFKLVHKLLGGFLVIALIGAIIGAVGYFGLGQVQKDVQAVNDVNLPGVVALGDLSRYQQAVWVGERGLTNSRMMDPKIRAAQYTYLDDKWTKIDAAYKAYEPLPKTKEEAELWKSFTPKWDQWKAEHGQVRGYAEARDRAAASGGKTAGLESKTFAASLVARKTCLETSAMLEKLVSINTKAADESAAQASSIAKRSQVIMLVSIAAGVLISVLLGYFLASSIATPMAKGVEMMQELAKGHLGLRLRMNRGDEIGTLTKAMDGFADDLQQNVVVVMQQIANGDLSANVTAKDAKDEISPALQSTLEALRGLIADMNRMSSEHNAGDIDVQIPVEKYAGAFREMGQGVNDMVAGHIAVKKKAMACAAEFGLGNFDAPLEKFPGKKAFINDTLEQVRANLKALIEDADMLVQAALDGRLATRADAGRHQGGFRKIVQGVNDTLDAVVNPVNEAAQALERVANRDLTARMQGDYKGDLAKIKNALNRAVENLDDGLSQVAMGAEQVASASGQISAGSQTLSQGASEQASSLQEVSSSLQEMASMTRQNTGNAVEARAMAEGARDTAGTGVASMQRLSDAIDRIKNSSDQTAKIIKTIDEIAFQTNLLALNAAVEAARAGDAGKGFAVVAEEVRNLAMRSAEAAKNTSNLIEESVKNAQDGVSINQEVYANLEEINQQIGRVGEVMAEIATAGQQQTQGIDQINDAVGQMDQVTQMNAANSEESASAAEELSGQAEEMRALVASFQLSNSVAASGRRSAPSRSSGSTRRTGSTRSKSNGPSIPLDGDMGTDSLSEF